MLFVCNCMAHSFYNNRKSVQNLSTASNLIATNKQLSGEYWWCITPRRTINVCLLSSYHRRWNQQQLSSFMQLNGSNDTTWRIDVVFLYVFFVFDTILMHFVVLSSTLFIHAYYEYALRFDRLLCRFYVSIDSFAFESCTPHHPQHINLHRIAFILFIILRLHTTRSITHYA